MGGRGKQPATTAADLDRYLREATADGYPATELRVPRCRCGGDVFRVDVDDDEGVAQRSCIACGHADFICDSGEYWADAEPEQCACPCGGEAFNLCVGFALFADSEDVRWLYIALRCTRCGELGIYADWKIDYAPSKQLLDEV